MLIEVILSVFVFLLGSCVGSFLNVCIYRMPEGRSIVTPRSHCACGKMIPWYHNLPLFSWLILRGRASCCQKQISVRYWIVELLVAVLFLYLFWQYHLSVAIVGMFFSSLLVVICFIDWDHMIIPDSLSLGGLLLGCLVSIGIPELHGEYKGIHGLWASVIGVGVGSAVLLWIAIFSEWVLQKETMGFGDVKLMGCIGAFLGWEGAVFSIFGGAVLGTVILMLLMVFQYLKKSRSIKKNNFSQVKLGKAIPFGPFLILGAILYLLGAQMWVDPYLHQIGWIFNS